MTDPHSDPHWYVMSRIGLLTLCADEADARESAGRFDKEWPDAAPHRAVQLVAVEADRRARMHDKPSCVSDSAGSDRQASSKGRVPSDEEIVQLFADVVGNTEDGARFLDLERDHAILIARALLSRYGSMQSLSSEDNPAEHSHGISDPEIRDMAAKAGVWVPLTGIEKEQTTQALRRLIEGMLARAALAQQPSGQDESLADTQRAIIEAAERRGYARAEAENVGYRTDAGRYRFIRPGDKDVWCSSGDDLLTGDQLDAAIDAARVLGFRGVAVSDEQGTAYLIDMLGRENELVRE